MIIVIKEQPFRVGRYLPFYSMSWIIHMPQMPKGGTTITSVVRGVSSGNGLIVANYLRDIRRKRITLCFVER